MAAFHSHGVRRLVLGAVVTASAVLAAAASVQAAQQNYPLRPIRIVVPFSAGGPADLVGRVLSEKLQPAMGQSVVVVNKDGAGTILGVDYAAKATADGYTLLLGSLAMVLNASSGRKLPYDTYKDLVPVTLSFGQPLVLLVHPSLPVNSVRDFVAHAKAHPGKLRFGSSGIGSSIHLTAELFSSAVGIRMVHVPYRGVAPAMVDLLSGQVDLMFPGITPAVPHIRSGKLKVLAVTSSKRSGALPDAPTFIESGMAGFEVSGWFGIFVPAGTPRAIISRLNAELVKVLNMPDVREKLASQGGEAMTSTAEHFAQFMSAEHKRWSGVIRAANIKVE